MNVDDGVVEREFTLGGIPGRWSSRASWPPAGGSQPDRRENRVTRRQGVG
ncbi:hypothetical protein ACFU6K_38675 [Kitasatospora sp. NPDC057512]